MFKDVFVDILQKKGLSPYKVAKDTGISQGQLSYYARGERTPTDKNLIKIAEYLGVSTDYLLGKESEPINNNEFVSFTEEEKLLLDMFRKMDLIQKAKLITFAAELMKKD